MGGSSGSFLPFFQGLYVSGWPRSCCTWSPSGRSLLVLREEEAQRDRVRKTSVHQTLEPSDGEGVRPHAHETKANASVVGGLPKFLQQLPSALKTVRSVCL